MPIYIYECVNDNCRLFEDEQEIVLKSSEHGKDIQCPLCGYKMQRVISLSNFHLKGDCWSRDNYERKGKE